MSGTATAFESHRSSPVDGRGAGVVGGRSAVPGWIAAGFFWFALAAVHVVVDPAGFDIALLPRLAVLLGVLATILVAVVVGGSRACDAAPLREPIVAWFAVYVASVWVSLAWAFNPAAGLADGFKSAAVLTVLVLTPFLLPALPRWRERLPVMAGCGVLAVVASAASEILAARGGLLPGIPFPDRPFMEAHVTGSQSNVNLLADLLVLLLPWCLCGIATATGWRRWWAGVAAAAALTMIVLTQSRAALLGLAAGAGVAVVATLAAATRLGLSRDRRLGVLAAVVAAGGALAGFLVLAPDDVGFARRLRSIVVDPPPAAGVPFRDGGRREMWRVTGRMIADRPLTGVGAGNFGIAVQAYYDERLDLSRMHHNWQNPHNDFLWVFAEKGIVGIVAFVGVLLAAVRAACRVLALSPRRPDAWLAVGMLAFLASYATMSCFDFPLERVSQPVLLAISCGTLAVLARRPREVSPPVTVATAGRGLAGRPGRAAVAAAAAVLAVGAAWAVAVVVQERRIVEIYRAHKAGRWEAMLAAARAAEAPWRTIDTHLVPIAYHEGYALMKLGRSAEAITSLERSLDHNPNRLATLSNLGILYAQAGRFEEAEVCLREVVRRYPQYPPGYVNLAGCLIDAGRPEEARRMLEEIPAGMRTTAIRRSLEQARAAAEARRVPAG